MKNVIRKTVVVVLALTLVLASVSSCFAVSYHQQIAQKIADAFDEMDEAVVNFYEDASSTLKNLASRTDAAVSDALEELGDDIEDQARRQQNYLDNLYDATSQDVQEEYEDFKDAVSDIFSGIGTVIETQDKLKDLVVVKVLKLWNESIKSVFTPSN